MEWKEPNWNWIWTKYAQVDKDGKVKVQNNDMALAINNAKASGYAVWEKATKKMIYPVIPIQIVPEIEDNPIIDYTKVKELTDKLATQITYLNSIVSQIQDTLREIE